MSLLFTHLSFSLLHNHVASHYSHSITVSLFTLDPQSDIANGGLAAVLLVFEFEFESDSEGLRIRAGAERQGLG